GFTYNSVHDRDVYLKAVDRYTKNGQEATLEHRVRLNVKQSVTSVELSETEKTIWWSDGVETHFAISATAYPDDATDKTLDITIDNEGVGELVGENEEGYPNFIIKGKGTATITFTSVDNSSVSATCTVTVKKRVTELVVKGDFYNMFNDGQEYMATLSYFPVDADFNIDALTIDIVSDLPEGWTPVEIEQGDMADGFMQLNLIPRAICNNFMVDLIYHNPEDEMSEPYVQSIEAAVMERITMGGGWNWVSLINGEVWLEELSKQLIEARSQNELVFNDASWGLFGDLYSMDNTQAYKVNLREDYGGVELYPYSDNNIEGYIHTKSLKKGWNWVSYPYEFEYGVEQIFAAANFSENDMILSKHNGFVQRNADGEWEGNLSALIPYQGYMVYCNADVELPMPGRYDLEQGYFKNIAPERAASHERAAWVYDNSRFANSMAIVAKVDVENCEDYSIGAFVGDECRGEGKFINGKAFITVGGESGEVVNFRLYNKWTGEFLNVTNDIEFCDMAGSLNAPVLMGVLDGTTGIVDINTINGNNIEAIYDITGRKVTEMTDGIYIIKVREGDKTVTKKVRK
ncbi:MAG: hypothetical protein J6S03_00650, partial [Bacteroidaceae bacterium]|nr:hypothetical protein [Bacteroidaceae bacterium]